MTTVNLTQRSSITEEDVKIRFRKILKVTRSLHEQNYMHGWLVGWLVVFNVPSTARSFRDSTQFTVPCEGHEAQFFHISISIEIVFKKL